MGRTAPRSLAPRFYLALNAAALLAAAALMACLAYRGSGITTPRAVLIGAAAMLGLALGAVAVHLQFHLAAERRLITTISKTASKARPALTIAFILLWCVTWFPPGETRAAYYYFIALYPIILCGLLIVGSALFLFALPGGGTTSWWREYLAQRRPAIRIALVMLAAFGLIALLTAQLGILQGYEPFWYGAGVPLLAAQVLLASVVAAVASRVERRPRAHRLPTDAILFAVIWIIAALLWSLRSVPASYWVTAPRPPNFEFYPFSDSITYDLGSQFALIGQGIYNRVFFDRALYMSFLVYLHMVGGQNFQRLMSIQAALFAVFPALLYLLGRQLHSRAAGLALAALVMIRGLTSLEASAWIDTATFKHMMTDFPTALGVAAFLVLILRWSESPGERTRSLLWACGVLGLTSLVRPHVMLLMGATLLLAIWQNRAEKTRALVVGILASAAFLAAVLPWMLLGSGAASPIVFYGDRVRTVIAQRFPRSTPVAPPTPASAPGPAITPSPVVPEPAVPPGQSYAALADPGVPFVVDHLLHNFVTAGLVFPTSPQFLSVRSVVKEGEDFWLPRWGGDMSPLSALMLTLSLACMAFGIGLAAQRHRLRGFIPLAVLVLYVVVNALARTSGGRYIVPVDWILITYFAVAVAELVVAVERLLKGEPATAKTSTLQGVNRRQVPSSARPGREGASWNPSQTGIVLLLITLVGLTVPLAGVLQPPRFSAAQGMALAEEFQTYVPRIGDVTAVNAFLQQPGAVLLRGRLLYPLFYRQGDGEPTRYAPYTAREYPRTVFVLIGPQGAQHVMIPGAKPGLLPNASDALVLGCRQPEGNFSLISAVAVALPAEGIGLLRSPAAELGCPLPEPVCDNNHNCR